MSGAVSSAPISFIGSGWNLNNPTSHYFMLWASKNLPLLSSVEHTLSSIPSWIWAKYNTSNKAFTDYSFLNHAPTCLTKPDSLHHSTLNLHIVVAHLVKYMESLSLNSLQCILVVSRVELVPRVKENNGEWKRHCRWLQKNWENHRKYQEIPASRMVCSSDSGDLVGADVSTPLSLEHSL